MSDETAKNAEEGEGFTFVDKRRASADAAPEAQEFAADEALASGAPDADELAADVEGSEIDGDDEADFGGMPGMPTDTLQIALYSLSLLQMNALTQLGLIADQSTGKAKRDLPQARLAIDCVAAVAGVLDQADSPLDDRAKGELKRMLTDLRLNYVTQSQMAGIAS